MSDGLFTREEVLGGFPARRAEALLFLVEHVTARAVQGARAWGSDLLETADEARRRDAAYLEAYKLGRDPPRPVRAHDLERHAAAWAPLVPESAAGRAALARMMGRKYALHARSVPRIRAALGLDTAEVREAYRGRYGESLEALYAPTISPLDRLRALPGRAGAALEDLPPFWMVTLMTATLSLPVAAFGIPIAVAGAGIVPGLALLLGIGAVVTVTMGAMAETAARSGPFRYGNAFMGRLIADFLGERASVAPTLLTGARSAVSVLAASIGLALTLDDLTDVPAEIWQVALLAVVLAMLARGVRLAFDVLTLVGIGSLVLMLAVSAISAFSGDGANLRDTGPDALGGDGSARAALAAAIGIVLIQYIGHIYLVGIAKIALPRDPGGRSLVRGAMAGTAIVTAIVGIWIVAVCAAVPPESLAHDAGTALNDLADRTGLAVAILGGVLGIVLLGLSINRASVAVFGLVDERLRAGPRLVRFLAACSPVAAMFLIGEGLLLAGEASFNEVMTFGGVIANLFVAGMLPMLLVASARRKAERAPDGGIGRWGGPPAVVAVHVVCLGTLVLFGAVLWDELWQRLAAFGVAAWIVVALVRTVRGGALRPRAVVELRDDARAGRRPRYALLASGARAEGEVTITETGGGRRTERGSGGELPRPADLRALAVAMPGARAAELKVWSHRVREDGTSEAVPAEVTLDDGTRAGPAEEAIVPLPDEPWTAGIRLVADDPGPGSGDRG